MALESKAAADFTRAVRKALWRKVASWLRGEKNELIPYHEVRSRLPLEGQSYRGVQTIPLDHIIGSTGRYRDFDRAFLPRQTLTRDRWISVDLAHHQDVILPPVQVYKIGDAYFVRDGNHRVSVAREQGQLDIEAEVIEIRVPVPLSPDTSLDDLDRKAEYARFLEVTGLKSGHPEADIQLTMQGAYDRLLEHINVHRWYLGQQKGTSISLEEAAASWYQQVYSPLATAIDRQAILVEFPGRTLADLYLWISEYQWFRRQAYQYRYSAKEAEQLFATTHGEWPVSRLLKALGDAAWLDHLIMAQEKEAFYDQTGIQGIRPDAAIEPSLPGQYTRLLEHINVHRWYLGVERGEPVPLQEAVASWYDRVYEPLVDVIREEGVLADFPGRSEADLYLWIIENRESLLENGDASM
jgi:hypothetical protein